MPSKKPLLTDASRGGSGVSVLILTSNEAGCITRCIESVVGWSDDIVVLDDFSTDDTVAIAKSYPGVRTYQAAFRDFAAQRNRGLKEITYTNKWVLLLDADERAAPALKREVTARLASLPPDLVSLTVRRKDFFNQKWIPALWHVRHERLVRPEKVEFVGAVHEKLSSRAHQGDLRGHIEHFPFSKGLEAWMSRRVGYAEITAAMEMEGRLPFRWRELFSFNPMDRQRAKKAVFQRLPFRGLIYFFYLFLFGGGYRAGVDGLHFCILETFSQYFVVLHKRALAKN